MTRASQASEALGPTPTATAVAAARLDGRADASVLSVVPPLADPVPVPHFSIVIGRRAGTVVVTVHGEVDMLRAGHLGHILADLIDGQGNLSLVVDLHDATASDPDSLSVFVEAVERARQRGGTVTLAEPAGRLREALQLRGLDNFVGVELDVRASRDGGT